MRRRTKPRVVWFPKSNVNAIPFEGDVPSPFTNILAVNLDLTGVAPGNTVSAVIPVVIDETPGANAATTTLSDIENSGYRLRRIVGKCFAGISQADSPSAALLLVGAAFIILRTDKDGIAPAAGVATDFYNLFDLNNDDSPWIWRREWILQNGESTNPTNKDYPFTNAEYGSAADGPHIDQKTARVIGQDERLFFVASAVNLSAGDAVEPAEVTLIVTPRVLGSMRSTVGNRRNANR